MLKIRSLSPNYIGPIGRKHAMHTESRIYYAISINWANAGESERRLSAAPASVWTKIKGTAAYTGETRWKAHLSGGNSEWSRERDY